MAATLYDDPLINALREDVKKLNHTIDCIKVCGVRSSFENLNDNKDEKIRILEFQLDVERHGVKERQLLIDKVRKALDPVMSLWDKDKTLWEAAQNVASRYAAMSAMVKEEQEKNCKYERTLTDIWSALSPTTEKDDGKSKGY